jgi:hypothetical protein
MAYYFLRLLDAKLYPGIQKGLLNRLNKKDKKLTAKAQKTRISFSFLLAVKRHILTSIIKKVACSI